MNPQDFYELQTKSNLPLSQVVGSFENAFTYVLVENVTTLVNQHDWRSCVEIIMRFHLSPICLRKKSTTMQ